jgi:hypothetical protein
MKLFLFILWLAVCRFAPVELSAILAAYLLLGTVQ